MLGTHEFAVACFTTLGELNKRVFMWSQKAKFMANMGPTWVLLALDGLHVGPMKLAIRVCKFAGYMSMMTNLYHNLCYRLDNSSSSVMYSHHLISKYAIRWRLFFHLQCCQVEGKQSRRFENQTWFLRRIFMFSHIINSIFNLVLQIGIFRSSFDNALRWMS